MSELLQCLTHRFLLIRFGVVPIVTGEVDRIPGNLGVLPPGMTAFAALGLQYEASPFEISTELADLSRHIISLSHAS